MTLEQGFRSTQNPSSTAGMFNAVSFVARQMMAKCNVAMLVEVVSVQSAGELAPAGFIEVRPMVNQTDGYGNAIPHGSIFGVPYIRAQGGASAIIIDPQVGDIGLMVCSDRDISRVKKTKAAGNPGSRRRFDLADGIYVGGLLNGTPTQYVRMSSSGIVIESPQVVTVKAPAVNLQDDGGSLQTLLNSTLLTWLNAHVHTSATAGSPTSAPTTQPPASVSTSITKAE